MTQSRPVQNAFSSGEVDPLLAERNDFQRFQTGLAKSAGFTPLRQGGFTRAPGTLMRGSTRNDQFAIRIPFTFARNDSQALEFTDGKMRVWRYGALVEASGGGIYEIDTPFTEADLPNLDWVQNGDVLYILDGRQPVQKVSRLALDNWTIEPLEFTNGPFQVQNLDEDKNLSCSASTGSITLTTDWDFFTADHVGMLLHIKPTDFNNVPLWVGNQDASVGDMCRYDGKIYELAAGTDTGLQPPVHSAGTVKTGFGSDTKWSFVSTEDGIVKITAVTDLREATADVVKTIPKPAVDDATYRWSEGAWNEIYGYPSRIARYRKRLYLANSESFPRMIWASTLGLLSDFEPGDLTDSSFAYEIAGEGTRNEITWIAGGGQRGIYIGALGEVYRGFSAAAGQTIGPATFDTEVVDTSGSAGAKPIMPYGFPVYISIDQTRVLETRYSFEKDGSKPLELSLPSQHIAQVSIEQIVWQSAPHHYAWMRRSDGMLVCLVYYPDQDVLGWAPVPIAEGHVEGLDVTVSPDGAFDVLTLIVRREIDGEVKRFVEEQAVNIRPLLGSEEPISFNHAFSGLSFDLEDANDTFSLPHLVGETVWAWTDRGHLGPYVVDGSGEVTLSVAVNKAIIGLPDDSHRGRSLAIPAAAPDGDSRGRKRRIESALGVSVFKTAAGKIRALEKHFAEDDVAGEWEFLIPRGVAEDIGPVLTGMRRVDVPSGYADAVHLEYAPEGIAPMTITAQIANIEEANA